MLKPISGRLEFDQNAGLVELEPEYDDCENDKANDVKDVYPSGQEVDLGHLIRQVEDAHSNAGAD